MITELDAKMVGISKETLDKMAAAGVTSLQALSGQKAKTLSELSGVGEDTLEKAINKAIKLTSMGFITGEQLQQQRSERTHLHTGSYALDAIISKVGGIESQTTTEIIGAGAIGKTQIAHQFTRRRKPPKIKYLRNNRNGTERVNPVETT